MQITSVRYRELVSLRGSLSLLPFVPLKES